MRRRPLGVAFATLVTSMVVTSCVAPPSATNVGSAPTSAFVAPTIAASLDDLGRSLVVRVRNQDCEGVAVGSGFFIRPDTIMTNRHVVNGAGHLDVTTWDGRTLHVTAATQSTVDDLAIVRVSAPNPTVASLAVGNPSPGDEVHFVGYPQAEKIASSRGRVVDLVGGSSFGIRSKVVRINAPIEPGNSGGPLFNASNQVVGVVFAVEIATGYALAIPISQIELALADQAQFKSVHACHQ